MRNIKLNNNLLFNVGLILIVGLMARMIIGSVLNYEADFRGGDSEYYLEVAHAILNNGMHGIGNPPEPTFFRAPLYPFFSAGIIYVFGESAFAFFVVQSVLTIVLGLAIFFMLNPSKPAIALLAALMIVSSPSDIFFNSRVLCEGLVTFFLVLGVVQTYIARSSVQYFVAGLLFGLASLVRDVYVLLPILLIFYLIIFRREPIKFSVFLLAGVLVIVGPWILRNTVQKNGGLFISKGASGFNLWVGTWERDSQWTINQKFPDYAFSSDEEKRVIKYLAIDNDDKYMQELAFNRLSNDLTGVVAIWVKRAPRLWIGTRGDLSTLVYERYSVRWYFAKYSLFAVNIIILIGAAIGVFLAIRKSKGLVVFVIPLIYTFLIYLPFHSTETRYSQPMYPIIFIFLAYLCVELLTRFKSKAN